MDVDELVRGTRDALRAQIVYGEPIERDGAYILPAAKVTGGGGGGGDNEKNGGGGFGIRAKPAGAWVIRGDAVTWQPAIDVNRVIFGGQLVAIVALFVLRSIFRRR